LGDHNVHDLRPCVGGLQAAGAAGYDGVSIGDQVELTVNQPIHCERRGRRHQKHGGAKHGDDKSPQASMHVFSSEGTLLDLPTEAMIERYYGMLGRF
jgi:hypothetical protein